MTDPVVTLKALDRPEYGHPDDRRYDVLIGGVSIGSVESRRSASYRKAGRLRAGLVGYPKTWYGFIGGRRVCDWATTRTDAVDAVLKAARG